MNPASNNFLNPAGERFQKHLFYICLFGYGLMNVYGLVFYKLRFLMEGTSWLSIWMADGGFGIAWKRYAFMLNKLLVPVFYQLHLPLKTIAILFCLHDVLFYLCVAVLIIFFTRKYYYAATILAAPLLINGSNFYFIINELFISGSLMVLYAACYNHMQKGIIRTTVLVASMFFIIWSHPVMLLVLFVFLAGTYKSLEKIKQDSTLLLYISIMAIARVWFINDYETARLNTFQHPPDLTIDYFINTATDYLRVYWYMVFLAMWLLYQCLGTSARWSDYVGMIVIFPVLVYCCSANALNITNAYFAKYMYPVHLFILYKAAENVNTIQSRNNFFPLLLLTLILVAGAGSMIMKWHPLMTSRLKLVTTLNQWCTDEDPQQSKWFVKDNLLLPKDQFDIRFHTEVLFFSALENPTITKQLVRANQEELKLLSSIPPSSIFLNEKYIYSAEKLNRHYFHIQQGLYRELVIDSNRSQLLQSYYVQQ